MLSVEASLKCINVHRDWLPFSLFTYYSSDNQWDTAIEKFHIEGGSKTLTENLILDKYKNDAQSNLINKSVSHLSALILKALYGNSFARCEQLEN